MGGSKRDFGVLARVAIGLLVLLPGQALAASRPPQFVICASCHKTNPAEKSAMGPNLAGIGGRVAGTADFAFSPAMKKAGLTWNRTNLIAFVTAPQRVVPGNRMAYAGQKDPKLAAAIADYMLSLER